MNIEVNCELQTRITWSLECGGITFVPSAVRARCTKYTVRAGVSTKRRPKNEDPNIFMPDKARTGKKPSQRVPQRKQMQKKNGVFVL